MRWHSNRLLLLPFSAFLSGLGACEGAGNQSSESDAATRALCSSCALESLDVAVERSSDGCCTVTSRTAVAVDDPRATALGAAHLVSNIEAGYDGPFQWRRSWGSSSTNGYEPATAISIATQVTGIELVEQDRALDSLTCNVECNDYLDFAVHFDLQTADEAIAGSGDTHAASASWTEAAVVSDEVPLSGFVGTLELTGSDASPDHGGLIIRMTFSDRGTQGRISPWIEEHPRDPRGVQIAGEIEGRWPTPTCIDRGTPILLDQSWPTPDSPTVQELLNAFFEMSRAAPVAKATWNDDSSTELIAEIVGEPKQACAGGLDKFVHVTVPLHLQTADGKLDATLDAEVSLLWEEDALSWGWHIVTDVMDTDSLVRVAGAMTIEPPSSEAVLDAAYSSTSDGKMTVVSAADPVQRDYLHW